MRMPDAEMTVKVFPLWAKQIGPIKDIAMASPDQVEIDLMRQAFPLAKIHPFTKETWDLSKPAPRQFDLFWCVSVFMCSPDPKLWFENVLASSKHVWMLEHIEAWRCGIDGPEMAKFDGDLQRYHLGDERAVDPDALDLSAFLGNRIVSQVVYPVQGVKGNNRSFIIWIKT